MTNPAQLSLDDPRPGQKPARARRTDVESSHLAADRAESSGLVANHTEIILRLVARYPGMTAKELAALRVCPLDHVAINRRVKEMVDAGYLQRTQHPDGYRLYRGVRAFTGADA